LILSQDLIPFNFFSQNRPGRGACGKNTPGFISALRGSAGRAVRQQADRVKEGLNASGRQRGALGRPAPPMDSWETHSCQVSPGIDLFSAPLPVFWPAADLLQKN